MSHESAYSILYHLSQKEESNKTNEILVSNIRDTLDSLEVRPGERPQLQKKLSYVLKQSRVKRSASGVSLPDGSIARDWERMALQFRRHWDLLTNNTGYATEDQCLHFLESLKFSPRFFFCFRICFSENCRYR